MIAELRADLTRFPGRGWRRWRIALCTPGSYSVVVYRFGFEAYHRRPGALAVFAKVLYKLLAFFINWATGIYLSPAAVIGPGLYIGHWGGIRVAAGVRLGARCNLSPMVILGTGVRDGRRGVPWIGDRVYVGAGAKVFGPVRVGDDAAIGANAVVCADVPDHVSVGGVPARVISHHGSGAHLEIGQSVQVEPARINELRFSVTPAPVNEVSDRVRDTLPT